MRNRSHFVLVSLFGRQKTERFVNTQRKAEDQVVYIGVYSERVNATCSSEIRFKLFRIVLVLADRF